jgi:hypothetical protein
MQLWAMNSRPNLQTHHCDCGHMKRHSHFVIAAVLGNRCRKHLEVRLITG